MNCELGAVACICIATTSTQRLGRGKHPVQRGVF